MIPLLSVGAVLVLLSAALLKASATAAFSVGRSRLRTLVDEGFAGASTLLELRERQHRAARSFRAAAFILNVAAAALLMALARMAAPDTTALLTVPAAVLVVTVFGHTLPRGVAARWPVRLALIAGPRLLTLERLLRMLLSPFLALESLASGSSDERSSDEREVLEITELGHEVGAVDAEERLLVERAFRLDELTAWDVMTPRVDIFGWSDALQLRDIVGQLEEVPYSRVPVYRDSIDEVTGILYVREAYAAYVDGQQDVPLSRLARDPFFVPGSLSVGRLLRDFQARRIHMGIVADEFGGTDGLVTLEDVLEELVGEIVDETDIAEEPVMRISRAELVADGSVDVREITYAFNFPLPKLENRSLNGLILEELGYVPSTGEVIKRDGFEIEILEASDTQVHRARLRRVTPPRSGEGDEGDPDE